jgi:hypothetical protein
MSMNLLKIAEVGVAPTIAFAVVMSHDSILRLVPANSQKELFKIDSDDYYCFQCPSDNIDTI